MSRDLTPSWSVIWLRGNAFKWWLNINLLYLHLLVPNACRKISTKFLCLYYDCCSVLLPQNLEDLIRGQPTTQKLYQGTIMRYGLLSPQPLPSALFGFSPLGGFPLDRSPMDNYSYDQGLASEIRKFASSNKANLVNKWSRA